MDKRTLTGLSLAGIMFILSMGTLALFAINCFDRPFLQAFVANPVNETRTCVYIASSNFGAEPFPTDFIFSKTGWDAMHWLMNFLVAFYTSSLIISLIGFIPKSMRCYVNIACIRFRIPVYTLVYVCLFTISLLLAAASEQVESIIMFTFRLLARLSPDSNFVQTLHVYWFESIGDRWFSDMGTQVGIPTLLAIYCFHTNLLVPVGILSFHRGFWETIGRSVFYGVFLVYSFIGIAFRKQFDAWGDYVFPLGYISYYFYMCFTLLILYVSDYTTLKRALNKQKSNFSRREFVSDGNNIIMKPARKLSHWPIIRFDIKDLDQSYIKIILLATAMWASTGFLTFYSLITSNIVGIGVVLLWAWLKQGMSRTF